MLIIYQVCQDEAAQSGELLVRAEWTKQPPQVGDRTSMGSDRDWSIVRLTEFKPIAEFQVVDAVFLAHVNPIELTLEAQWTCDQMREWFPLQSLEVALFAKGQPALEISYSMEGLPLVGQLFTAEPTPHSTAMRPVMLPWMIDRIQKYVPVGESPYTAVHLCWCMAMKEAVAA